MKPMAQDLITLIIIRMIPMEQDLDLHEMILMELSLIIHTILHIIKQILLNLLEEEEDLNLSDLIHIATIPTILMELTHIQDPILDHITMTLTIPMEQTEHTQDLILDHTIMIPTIPMEQTEHTHTQDHILDHIATIPIILMEHIHTQDPILDHTQDHITTTQIKPIEQTEHTQDQDLIRMTQGERDQTGSVNSKSIKRSTHNIK